MDRIRSVRTKRYKYIRNFQPERPYLQINRYKEHSYPMLPLLRELRAAGKLNTAQQHFMAEQRPPEELYDLESDPDEVHNLAGSRQHQLVLAHLREALNMWIKESKDQGVEPEDPAIVQYWEERMIQTYERRRKRD